MKRFGTVLFILILFCLHTEASAQLRNAQLVFHSQLSSASSNPVEVNREPNASPVFLPDIKGADAPLGTVVEADSNYTDTTDPNVTGGNGWYLLDTFGDTTESVSLSNGQGGTFDTTITEYNKGLGERFNTSLTKAYIDSVQVTLVPRALVSTDSLLFKVVPIWNQQARDGNTYPFIDYYGQSATSGQTVAAYTFAKAAVLPSQLTIGPGQLQTVTASFGAGGKTLRNFNPFGVTVQAQGPGIIGDTMEWQMEADLNSSDPNYAIDTIANRTYTFQLTEDNGVEGQGWAVDIPQIDQTGALTGSAYFGNLIMIAFLHGTSSGVENPSLPGYGLADNYPNPVGAQTTINYLLGLAGPVSLVVYNTLGQPVSTVVNQVQGVGEHSVSFAPGTLPNGMYYYKLQSGDFTATRQMVIAR